MAKITQDMTVMKIDICDVKNRMTKVDRHEDIILRKVKK
jgi:hypothetical protein